MNKPFEDALRQAEANADAGPFHPTGTDIAILWAQGEIEALRDLLAHVRDKGLVYWEPNTARGRTAKATLHARIDALLRS
jgi:MarR-like DNA-binding transcriptional regulator SgrR of sgrS sRNA